MIDDDLRGRGLDDGDLNDDDREGGDRGGIGRHSEVTADRREFDEDGFRPEDWSFPFRSLSRDRRSERDSLSTGGISPDFVRRTFARVREDQRRIRSEAAQVERITLRRDLLEAFAPPACPDFVESTLGRLRAERAQGAAGMQSLLEHYSAPRASLDFVDRTLDALRLSAQSTASEAASEPAPAAGREIGPRAPAASRRPVWRWIAAAAAAATLLWFATRGGDPADAPEARPLVATASEFSPAAINSAFARVDETIRGHLRLEPPDGLLLLVSGGGSGE